VKVIGLETAIEDRLRLTGQRYNPEPTQQELNARAIERYLERQTIYGSQYQTAGFDGLLDYAESKGSQIYANDSDIYSDSDFNETKLRDMVEELELEDVSKSDMLVVTGISQWNNFDRSLDDVQRYVIGQSNDNDALDLSFNTLRFRGVNVAKSHAIDKVASEDVAVAWDVSQFFYGVLRDVQMKALSPDQLNDVSVTYMEATLVSRARARTVALRNLGESMTTSPS